MNGNSNRELARGAKVQLHNLSKRFGKRFAVDALSLEIPAGSLVVLLGPSGSGKSTALNLIAGFLSPDDGDIAFDNRPMAEVPPNYRNIGMVFQSPALFPHLNVADNVAFPLRMRTRMPPAVMTKRIADTLSLVQMDDFAKRLPRQLSAEQQQRVAIARALASHPRVLLMDEPLGGLDQKAREQMQWEIKRIHRALGMTLIYATNDAAEAMTMADTVVLMDRGRPVQTGVPRDLYNEPATLFVADFIGDSNLLPGHVTIVTEDAVSVALDIGVTIPIRRRNTTITEGRVVMIVRPEEITLRIPGGAARTEPPILGKVIETGFQGDSYRLSVAVGDEIIKVKVPPNLGAPMRPGMDIQLVVNRNGARLLKADESEEPAKSPPPP